MLLRTGAIALLAAVMFAAGTHDARSANHADSAGSAQGREVRTEAGDSTVHQNEAERDETTSQPEYVIRPWRALRGHLHNKIIHVPIGFALSAFFLSLLALRYPEVQPALRWLVLLAALGALAAYLSGTSQAEALEGGSKDWVIETHERLAIATGLLLWGWTLSLWLHLQRKWALLLGLLVVILIVLTGFFGGILAHG